MSFLLVGCVCACRGWQLPFHQCLQFSLEEKGKRQKKKKKILSNAADKVLPCECVYVARSGIIQFIFLFRPPKHAPQPNTPDSFTETPMQPFVPLGDSWRWQAAKTLDYTQDAGVVGSFWDLGGGRALHFISSPSHPPPLLPTSTCLTLTALNAN